MAGRADISRDRRYRKEAHLPVVPRPTWWELRDFVRGPKPAWVRPETWAEVQRQARWPLV